MKTSQVTSKGQITVPAKLRQQLGLRQGDQVGFEYEDGKISIFPVNNDISAAFGVIKASVSVSLDDMDKAIKTRGSRQ